MDTAGKPTTESEITLWKIVMGSIRDLDKTENVDPALVARHAFARIPHQKLRDEAVMMALRHIAREILRKLHKPNGKSFTSSRRASGKTPTFPGDDFRLLQARYPKAHMEGKLQGYVPLEALTESDWNWNLDQLKYDGGAKLAHMRQLQRWGEKIKGFIREEPIKEVAL